LNNAIQGLPNGYLWPLHAHSCSSYGLVNLGCSAWDDPKGSVLRL